MMTVSRWGTQCACLFFALLQGLLQSAGATHGNVTTATSPRLNRTNGLYEICISDWTPMVSCDGKNNTADVSGYQVEVFRAVADALGWQPGQFYLRCMDWTPMVMDLADANGTCFMSAAGMDVTPDSITEGIKYSWPTYKQGLRILTKATVETGDTWSVFRVFDWRVWLAMGGTAILVGVILYITETFQPRMMRRMMYNIKDESDFAFRWRSNYDTYGVPQHAAAQGYGPGAAPHPDQFSQVAGGAFLGPPPSSRPPKLSRLASYAGYAAQLHRTGSDDGSVPLPIHPHAHSSQRRQALPYGAPLQHFGHPQQYGQRGGGGGGAPQRISYDGSYDPSMGVGSVHAATEAGAPIGSPLMPAYIQQRRALHFASFGNTAYYTIAKFVDMGNPEPLTLAGRTIAMAYGFLILIMMNLYTANTAAAITTKRLNSRVTSREDLPGKAVGTWTSYVATLRRYNVFAQPFAWENSMDEQVMIQALQGDSIRALVLDASFVLYQASQICNLYAIGDSFDTWDLAFAFPPETPTPTVDLFTNTIVNHQRTTAFLDELQAQFMESGGVCGKKEVADFATLQFHQVVALWLILGGAVVLAAVSFIFHFIFAKCFRRYAKRKGLIPNSNMKTPNTAAGTSHKSLAVDSVPIGGYETKTRASPSSWACSPTGQGLGPQGAVYGQGDGRAALEPRMLSMVQEGVEGSVTEGSAPGPSRFAPSAPVRGSASLHEEGDSALLSATGTGTALDTQGTGMAETMPVPQRAPASSAAGRGAITAAAVVVLDAAARPRAAGRMVTYDNPLHEDEADAASASMHPSMGGALHPVQPLQVPGNTAEYGGHVDLISQASPCRLGSPLGPLPPLLLLQASERMPALGDSNNRGMQAIASGSRASATAFGGHAGVQPPSGNSSSGGGGKDSNRGGSGGPLTWPGTATREATDDAAASRPSGVPCVEATCVMTDTCSSGASSSSAAKLVLVQQQQHDHHQQQQQQHHQLYHALPRPAPGGGTSQQQLDDQGTELACASDPWVSEPGSAHGRAANGAVASAAPLPSASGLSPAVEALMRAARDPNSPSPDLSLTSQRTAAAEQASASRGSSTPHQGGGSPASSPRVRPWVDYSAPAMLTLSSSARAKAQAQLTSMRQSAQQASSQHAVRAVQAPVSVPGPGSGHTSAEGGARVVPAAGSAAADGPLVTHGSGPGGLRQGSVLPSAAPYMWPSE